MSDFIQELKNDHRVIQQVVAGMSAVAELLDSGKQVDPSVLADLVQFSVSLPISAITKRKSSTCFLCWLPKRT